MEKKIIDYTNKKWFWTYLDEEQDVEEVCNYLKDNNLQIELIGNTGGGYESRGQNVMLEGVDLSGNGHCFNGKNLLLHVKYFKKITELSNTDEFKDWLSKYDTFKIIKSWVIDKDQRWLNVDEINKILSKSKL